MKRRQIRKALLFLLIFVALYTIVFSYSASALHSCCVYEPYCTPCLHLDKLRDAFRPSVPLTASTGLALLMLLQLVMIWELMGRRASNPVELKARMSN